MVNRRRRFFFPDLFFLLLLHSMLPALVELEHLVLRYFSRRLTRAEAESLTFGEATARLPPEAQLTFTRAFREVEKVFESLREVDLAHPFGLCDRSKPPVITLQV